MRTRLVTYGSMMVLLAACSGSDDAGDAAGSQPTNAEATNEAANATAPSAPPASPAPAGTSSNEPPAEEPNAPPPTPAAAVPVITAVLPADGAIGVELKPKVTVTFSRSMDRASTEAAFSIEGAGLLSGAFEWSNGDTVLAFTPSSALSNGVDLTVKVTVSAKDKDGTNLATPLSSAFRSIRKSTVDLPVSSVVQCSASGQSIYIGQFFVGDDDTNKEYRSFATFDLSKLPADLTSIDAAWLNLRNGTGVGKATPMVAESVDYGPSLDCASDFGKAARTFVNPFSKQTLPIRSAIEDMGATVHAANLTLAVAMDWADRQTLGNRSMVRMQVAAPLAADASSDGMKWDGPAKLTRPTLIVTYQHP
jgi:hypothetical protein